MKTLFLEYWLPVGVWLTILFLFSTDAFSGSETSRIIVPLLTLLFPGLAVDEIELLHGVIRKAGHVAGYFILTILVHRSFNYGRADMVRPKVMTVGFVVAAAAIDEFHQSLTAWRGASIVDVGYDSFGCVWALWLITLYEVRRIRSHSIL